jgi:hypothetical protein
VEVRCDLRAAEDLFGVQRVMRATPHTQVRHQRRQVEFAPLDRAQQPGKAPHEPRGVDPSKRAAFAHAEAPHAEVEHRRARRRQMQAPVLDLDEALNQPRQQPPLVGTHRRETGNERFIGQVSERRVLIATPFAADPAPWTPKRPLTPADAEAGAAGR